MSVYQRSDIPKLLTAIIQGKPCPIYLLIGDRYLCQQAAEQLAEALLPEASARAQNLKLIDGDQEDPLQTLGLLKTYSLFGGRQVFRVVGSKLFHSKEVAKSVWDKAKAAHGRGDDKRAALFLGQLAAIGLCQPQDLVGLGEGQWQEAFAFAKPDIGWLAGVLVAEPEASAPVAAAGELAEQYLAALAAGWPEDNILMLLVETADKRKKLYAGLQKVGVVLDLSVAEGSSKAAREQQEAVLIDLVRSTLAEFGKTMEPRAVPVFLERVGFHPVAVVREAEKLALYSADTSRVTLADVQAMVARIREDAIFELTEAFSEQDISRTLTLASRLHEAGVHPLMMIAGLRKHLRTLMLVLSLRQSESPQYVEGMAFPVFQKGYLPVLKEGREEVLKQLPSHPYALYMMFVRAGRFSVTRLGTILVRLLEAEFALKSSPLPALTVLEHFFWRTLSPAVAGPSEYMKR